VERVCYQRQRMHGIPNDQLKKEEGSVDGQQNHYAR
jgi:hypothetical protein